MDMLHAHSMIVQIVIHQSFLHLQMCEIRLAVLANVLNCDQPESSTIFFFFLFFLFFFFLFFFFPGQRWTLLHHLRRHIRYTNTLARERQAHYTRTLGRRDREHYKMHRRYGWFK